MKRGLLCMIIIGGVYGFSGYAADRMITNDDLEKRYAPEAPAENKWWKWQQEKAEDNCRIVGYDQWSDGKSSVSFAGAVFYGEEA